MLGEELGGFFCKVISPRLLCAGWEPWAKSPWETIVRLDVSEAFGRESADVRLGNE